VGMGEGQDKRILPMIRTVFALLLCTISTALLWGDSLRFFAAWSRACDGTGLGWDTPLLTLFSKARWSSDLFLSSIAPSLPFLLFCGPKQTRLRHWAMMGGMIAMPAAVFALGGPPMPTPEDCMSKGPFPEIGKFLVGLFLAGPAAILIAAFTQRTRLHEEQT
jgi:hypothetical protein